MGLRDRIGSLKDRVLGDRRGRDRREMNAEARAKARRVGRQMDVGVGGVGVTEPSDAAGMNTATAEEAASRAAAAATVRGPIEATASPITPAGRDTMQSMVTGSGARGDLLTGSRADDRAVDDGVGVDVGIDLTADADDGTDETTGADLADLNLGLTGEVGGEFFGGDG